MSKSKVIINGRVLPELKEKMIKEVSEKKTNISDFLNTLVQNHFDRNESSNQKIESLEIALNTAIEKFNNEVDENLKLREERTDLLNKVKKYESEDKEVLLNIGNKDEDKSSVYQTEDDINYKPNGLLVFAFFVLIAFFLSCFFYGLYNFFCWK